MTEMGEQEDENDGTKECRVSRVRRENGRQCLNTRPISEGTCVFVAVIRIHCTCTCIDFDYLDSC